MTPEEEASDPFADLKDISDAVEIDGLEIDPTPTGSTAAPESTGIDTEKDHPCIAFLDLAVNQSDKYCQKHGIDRPNKDIWEDFSRPLINAAMWHYAPDGDILASPQLCAVLGIAGLGAAYLPVIMDLYDQHADEEQEHRRNEEKRRIDPQEMKATAEKPRAVGV